MGGNLVIVESPAKAKTIEKFLGEGFTVKSSFGHIRDLAKKDFGIDIENNYQPQYIVSDDKKKVVSELKKSAKEADMVWLASDEDREGEAIAWHLYEVLKLKPEKTRRIVFNEITKEAIVRAIENPRDIDINLVNAQQARRVLDRLVGFELSPVLWKKIKPSLSAGRVQSVSVRLLVDREREIMAFKPSPFIKTTGLFSSDKGDIKAELNKRFDNADEAKTFLNDCSGAEFSVNSIVKKPSKKRPAAPFTTSTLQQEASRKLGFSVAQTMSVAQKLYEAGKITYMRTDSLNLSDSAVASAKKMITGEYGSEYSEPRKYSTKTKGAQEAHEAIRPTYMENMTVSGSSAESKLYELIWKRTIASQMSEAKLEKTTININISNSDKTFVASGEVLLFDGFLKVYMESTDDETDEEVKGLLPSVKEGDKLGYKVIECTERFTQKPPRYTEASLVKKLEELGIGRPSTYAPTISTIQNRGYVIKEDRDGEERKYSVFTLKKGGVSEVTKTEITGAERNKLFPNDIGMVVNDFLLKNFEEIVNYNFTASVEEKFDDIAIGKIEWQKMIDVFYKPFHDEVVDTLENSERDSGERILGDDPKTGKPVSVRIGRFGPMAQLGSSDSEEKPQYSALRKGQHLETITLEEALELFKLPRQLGEYEGKVVTVAIGRFGPYVRHDGKFVSLKKGVDDPYDVVLERAIVLIEEKREADRKKFIKSFDEDADLQVLNGRWGPYISYQKKNYKIPKDVVAEDLSYQDCVDLIKKSAEPKKKVTRKKSTKKK
jgi:DNA topoisomerase-1